MVNDVDYRRFRQAFVTAVRKQFSDDEQVGGIILNTVSSCSQRFRQAFFTAVRKQFSDDEQVGGIILNTVSSFNQRF